MRINTIHNFIFKIIYKNKGEDEDYKYKNLISIYIITLLIFSSNFLQVLYLIIKDIFKLKDFVTINIYPKRSKDNNPTRNNDKRNDKGNDNPNTERININKQIDQDNNNNNNKNKQKEEMKSPQTIIINNKNKTNNNIKKPKERNENSELLITNNKNEINNYIDKPKEITEYPEPLDINNKNKIEATDIKFPKKTECPLNINNINNKNEINNYIDKPKEITEYPEPLDINNKNKIEATEIKFQKKKKCPLNINNINNKNEINNYLDKPKEITEFPDPIDINIKNEIETPDIKFPKKIECPLNINNINNKNEISNNIDKQKEITEYPDPIDINIKNEIETTDIKFPKKIEPPSNSNNINNKNEIEDGEHICVICTEKPTQVIIVPCGHKCLCLGCYEKEKENFKKCPICKQEIKFYLPKVYDV